MKHRATSLLAVMAGTLLLVSAFAGCSRASRQEQADQAPDIALALTVMPSPLKVGAAQALVELSAADGQPIRGAAVHLKGDMSHPGMRPVLAEAAAGDNGVYQADFQWTMAGDWVVTVTVELPDGRTAVRHFNLSVAAP